MYNRYINRPIRVNNLEFYKEFMEQRRIKQLNQYLTPNIPQLTFQRRLSLETVDHIWRTGDKLYKLCQRPNPVGHPFPLFQVQFSKNMMCRIYKKPFLFSRIVIIIRQNTTQRKRDRNHVAQIKMSLRRFFIVPRDEPPQSRISIMFRR